MAKMPGPPLTREDIGTLAASQQTNVRDGQSLMDTMTWTISKVEFGFGKMLFAER
jgi:hypothetical protein